MFGVRFGTISQLQKVLQVFLRPMRETSFLGLVTLLCLVTFFTSNAPAFVVGQTTGANATAAIEGKFVHRLFQHLIPALEKEVLAIVIPGKSEKHFHYGSFSLSSFSVSQINVRFRQPRKIHVEMKGLELGVPKTFFKVFTHILSDSKPRISKLGEKELAHRGGSDQGDFEISCKGHFWGAVHRTDIGLTLDVETTSEGKLHLSGVVSEVKFGDLEIHHDLDGFLCKVGQDIIQLFIGNLNDVIKKIVEKDLPSLLGSTVHKLGNEALSKLPATFLSLPEVVDDTLALKVQLLPPLSFRTPFLKGTEPTLDGSAGSSSSASSSSSSAIFDNRDISFEINSESVDDLLAVAAKVGVLSFHKVLPSKYNTTWLKGLFPELWNACPDCKLAVEVAIEPTYPPVIQFHDGTISGEFLDALMKLSAVNGSGSVSPSGNASSSGSSSSSSDAPPALIELVGLYSNISASFYNFSTASVVNKPEESLIKFDVNLGNFSLALQYSIVPNLDVSLVGYILQEIFQAFLIPEFNAHFKGFPLHFAKDGYALHQWTIDITNTSLVLGANVKLP